MGHCTLSAARERPTTLRVVIQPGQILALLAIVASNLPALQSCCGVVAASFT